MHRERFILVLIVTISCIAGPRTVSADELTPIYDDSLAQDWQNWSWNTTLNFANGDPTFDDSPSSIAVTYTSAWAGLYLHNDTPFNTSEYTALRFQIHGGGSGGHEIRVIGYDAGYNEGLGVDLEPTVAGEWTFVEIPLSAFGITEITGLVWQDTSGGPQPVYYLDAIDFVAGPPPPPDDGPDLTIDFLADRHPISPLIYGMNFADPDLTAELSLPVNRWGGNATTRYNWQLDTSSRASDWFFENIPNDNDNPEELPDGSASDDFIDVNESLGVESIITLPLMGWTPKERAVDCGFSVALYGPQQSTDPWNSDCGNGVATDGTPITGNDPLDTSLPIGPEFVQDWIAHLIDRYGTADQGGVQFYNLDNEPMLWNSTHRDVHPDPTSYDETRDRTFEYAAAIKAADPTAQTLGPVLWGWVAYFYSALDVAAGDDWWNTRPDRMDHGDIPFIEWYLQQMQAYEQDTGVRLLDYMDLHYYPQAPGVALQPAGDAATQALRLRSTRSLWDPTYVDESWIGEAVRLIPRMRDWIADHYPDTRLAITEYNWGGLEHINGALAQAEVLGLFGREGLDLATMWDPPIANQPGAFAFRMYRNYDGDGAAFGTTSVQAQSDDPAMVSIYAAHRADGAITVMVINKTASERTCTLTLTNFTPLGDAGVFCYAAADTTQISQLASLPISNDAVELSLPASSITLLAIPGPPPGDINADGLVNIHDLPGLVAVWLGLDADPHHFIRADLNADGMADGDDIAQFVEIIGTP